MAEIIGLNETVSPAKTVLTGSGIVNATAGQTLKMETSPLGEDILDSEVPAGKVWRISIHVNIEETDA